MKRLGISEDDAKAVRFLGFDANFMIGAELSVDGGQSQLRSETSPLKPILN